MLKYYLTLFVRDLARRKSSFLLNLAGLTLGMTCFLFALLFVFYETSYDGYQVRKDRIARVVTTVVSGGNVTKVAWANGFLPQLMTGRFPEIKGMVRLMQWSGRVAIRRQSSADDLPLEHLFYADSNAFQVFSYRLREGNPATCLVAPHQMVLTRTLARKLFGKGEAMNQTVVINGKPLMVSGVMDDLPGNSDLTFEGLISMNTASADDTNDWLYLYLLFNSPAAIHAFQPKLDKFARQVVNPLMGADANTHISYELQPLETIHFDNTRLYDTPKGNRVYVDIFLVIGILVLAIALTNSINLSVVKSFGQSSEFAVQKIYGASRGQLLLRQVIANSIAGITAALLAFAIVWMLLPEFGRIVDRSLAFHDLMNWKTLAGIFGALVLLGLSGALYMGFYLKQIPLSDALRSKSKKVRRLNVLPKLMLGFQFFITMGMVVFALVVYRQVYLFKNTPLGFSPQHVLLVDLPEEDEAAPAVEAFRNILETDPVVQSASFCHANALPGSDLDVDVMDYRQNGVKVEKTVNHLDVDARYFSVLGIPLIRGRDFPDVQDTGIIRHNAIVTDQFARNAGWTNPIGQTIRMGFRKTTVIGVVPDFHFTSLHKVTAPLVIFQNADQPAHVFVKTNQGNLASVLHHLQGDWKQAFPSLPFFYRFLDEHMLEQYRDETNLMELMLLLTALIMSISCIGLIAYVAFVVRNSRADIAVRRVLGASLRDVLGLFSRQYLWLMLIAFLAAGPVVWYLLQRWLGQFAYRVQPGVGDFLIAPLLVAGIVGVVVLYYAVQCMRWSAARVIREE